MLSQEHRNTLIIYYGFNEFELSNTAQKQLKTLLETAQKGEFYIENVTAYTDLNGDFQYNKNLAEKRIKSVEKIKEFITSQIEIYNKYENKSEEVEEKKEIDHRKKCNECEKLLQPTQFFTDKEIQKTYLKQLTGN